MRKISLFAILWLVMVCATCSAGTVTLSWDPEPATEQWTAVNIYTCTGTPGSYVCGSTPVATVTQAPPLNPATFPTSVTANVPAGTYVFTATASNGQAESVYSNYVSGTVLGGPATPTNLKLTLPKSNH